MVEKGSNRNTNIFKRVAAAPVRFIRKIKRKTAKLCHYISLRLIIFWRGFLNTVFKRKFAFLIWTPAHGNLGDHAITLAEEKCLKKWNISFVELTETDIRLLASKNKLCLLNRQKVLVQGGGFFGTLWYGLEKTLRDLFLQIKDASILVLPQTVYYEDNDWGREEFSKAIRIYEQLSFFKIAVREEQSFAAMKSRYENVFLSPDMVFAMDDVSFLEKRDGCLLCLRNDAEKTRPESSMQEIKEALTPLFGEKIRLTDTCIPKMVSKKERAAAVEKKLREFASAKLVVTDRLHGMLFSAITGTPCIVLDSKSYKVLGSAKWLTDCNYIQFCNSPSEISHLYETMPKGSQKYSFDRLAPYFETLRQQIVFMLQN